MIVTLAFGLAAAVTKGSGFKNFTHAEKILLGIALILFAVAAVFGLLVNMPAKAGAFPLTELIPGPLLSPMLYEYIEQRDRDLASQIGERNTAREGLPIPPVYLMIQTSKALRAVNRAKANLLVFGFLVQLVAISTLIATVAVIVI